jgi:hypothetical protein
MLGPIDTSVPDQVEEQVQKIFRGLFPKARPGFVSKAFGWAKQCFLGHYGKYQPIDAKYHDFEHTLQGALCMTRVLEGRHRAQASPMIPQHLVELGLLAVMFHDTGYLKTKDDNDGTGAKYTLVHVDRSAEFAAEFLRPHGYSAEDIQAIKNMIRCTGVKPDPTRLPFSSEEERLVGYALATGDLLGQMAASDYIDKLPILYQEFAEANQFSGDNNSRLSGYRDAQDLMNKTFAFWERWVWPRINNEFLGLYKYLNNPYPDGPNPYLDRIKANLARLQSVIVTSH